MAAIELRNVHALAKPDVVGLIKRAVESGALLAPGGWDSVSVDIYNFVADPQHFMILGAEAGAFRGIMMGFYPVGNLFPYPTVVLVYNEGSRKLSREMQDLLLDNMLEKGYTSMLAVNSSGAKDEVWQRALTPKGATSKKVGSLMLFEVE